MCKSRREVKQNMDLIYQEFLDIKSKIDPLEKRKKELSECIKTYMQQNGLQDVYGGALYLQEKDTKTLNEEMAIDKIKKCCKNNKELNEFIATKEVIIEDAVEAAIMNGRLEITPEEWNSCINHKITYALMAKKGV